MNGFASHDRRIKCFNDAHCHAGGGFRAGQMLRENGKLITAEARHHIAIAHRAEQTLSDDDQSLVSGTMAVDIVDLLEPVQIKEEDAVCGSRSGRRANSLPESLVKLPAVR